MNTNELIGKKIKNLRYEAKLTQNQLADELSIHPKHLSNIENGKKSITISLLDKLCNIFKKPAIFFFDFEEHKIFDDDIRIIDSIVHRLKTTDDKTRKDIAQIVRILVKK